MCVTNTTYRRSQPISLGQPQKACPSDLTQRLMGTFQLTVPSKPVALPMPSMPGASSMPLPAEFVHVAPQEKPRPKRRRKPQKPGKTAKMNDRHFVVHDYHDHAEETEDQIEAEVHECDGTRRKGGVSVAFPVKLHAILDQVERDGLASVISWQPHGRCFCIHQPKEFVSHVMPKYFRQTKLTSFQRQLNLYGFCRLTRGADAGGYYHELFLRGRTFLCKKMIRTKVKGTRFKAASSPEQEPDFYSMPPIQITPDHSPAASPVYSHEEESSSASSQSFEFPEFAAVTHPFQNSSNFLRNQFEAPLVNAIAPQAPLIVPIAKPPPMAQPASNFQTNAFEADRVLDEAVDELFMGDPLASGDLDDFVQDWVPNNAMPQSLQDDIQLGFMLDKLLED